MQFEASGLCRKTRSQSLVHMINQAANLGVRRERNNDDPLLETRAG